SGPWRRAWRAHPRSSRSSGSNRRAPRARARPCVRWAARLPRPSAGLVPDDEVDLRVEDLVDQGLVGRDTHLATPVAIVADLLVLVLLDLEAGDRLLVLDQADDVAAIRVEHGVDLGL